MGISTPSTGVRTNQPVLRRSSVTFPIRQAPNNLKPAIPGLGLGRTPTISLPPPIYYITGQTTPSVVNPAIASSPTRSIDASPQSSTPNSRNVSQDNLSNGSVSSGAMRSAYRAYENGDGDSYTPSNPPTNNASPQSISRSQSPLPMSQAVEEADPASQIGQQIGKKIGDTLRGKPRLQEAVQGALESDDVDQFVDKVGDSFTRAKNTLNRLPGHTRIEDKLLSKADPQVKAVLKELLDETPDGNDNSRNTSSSRSSQAERTPKKSKPRRLSLRPWNKKSSKNTDFLNSDEMELKPRKASRPLADEEPEDLLDLKGSSSPSEVEDEDGFIDLAPSSRRSTARRPSSTFEDDY